MNEAQCQIILCYFSDTVAIVFVNMCLTLRWYCQCGIAVWPDSYITDGSMCMKWWQCVMLATGSSITVSLLGSKKSFSYSRNWEMNVLGCPLLVPVISQMNPDHKLW